MHREVTPSEAFKQLLKHERAHPVSSIDGYTQYGMTLRDYFAGQALANPTICTGDAPEYYLRNWFGGRGGITKFEIVAKQAQLYADAMMKARPSHHESQP